MNQFDVPKVFQAKPSKLKKQIALIAFLAGTAAVTLVVTKVISQANYGAYFFAGGITLAAFAIRFWNMQVFNLYKVTFKTEGIEIGKRSSAETVAWAQL